MQIAPINPNNCGCGREKRREERTLWQINNQANASLDALIYSPLKTFVQMKDSLPRWDSRVGIRRRGPAEAVETDPRGWSWSWRLACIRVRLTRTTRHCPCPNSKYHCSVGDETSRNFEFIDKLAGWINWHSIGASKQLNTWQLARLGSHVEVENLLPPLPWHPIRLIVARNAKKLDERRGRLEVFILLNFLREKSSLLTAGVFLTTKKVFPNRQSSHTSSHS